MSAIMESIIPVIATLAATLWKHLRLIMVLNFLKICFTTSTNYIDSRFPHHKLNIGNREWVIGNGEWGMGNRQRVSNSRFMG
ncbi:MAG TPA: hypothetical protein DDW51_12740 [Cyanobacteria bacterium UBA11367]|nr:hypothetical protein [Cyanobacteria bacterium UBA11367]HBS69600.1 hypothetical protein [Cyanobacteria bacterium UBA11153]